MNNTDPASTRSRSVRRRSPRPMWGRWSMFLMLLMMVAAAALILFAGPEIGSGSWSTGGMGLILLLFLLPCLLMPFMMGRGHSDRSERDNDDERGGR